MQTNSAESVDNEQLSEQKQSGGRPGFTKRIVYRRTKIVLAGRPSPEAIRTGEYENSDVKSAGFIYPKIHGSVRVVSKRNGLALNHTVGEDEGVHCSAVNSARLVARTAASLIQEATGRRVSHTAILHRIKYLEAHQCFPEPEPTFAKYYELPVTGECELGESDDPRAPPNAAIVYENLDQNGEEEEKKPSLNSQNSLLKTNESLSVGTAKLAAITDDSYEDVDVDPVDSSCLSGQTSGRSAKETASKNASDKKRYVKHRFSVSVRGNFRSLCIYVSEDHVRIYRLTNVNKYGDVRYYRCSKCDMLNKTSSIKLNPKVMTKDGAICGNPFPRHHEGCKPAFAAAARAREIDLICRNDIRLGLATPREAWLEGYKIAASESVNAVPGSGDDILARFPSWEKIRNIYCAHKRRSLQSRNVHLPDMSTFPEEDSNVSQETEEYVVKSGDDIRGLSRSSDGETAAIVAADDIDEYE
ncbi:hypothetical protein AB6A40_002841 [Gnathostoma spinigerum]|uniref:RYYR-CCHC domain-containing protein n=1 Tax=Gnathostoma spinigerum TaxID=75299 RepID=A0ABD6EHT8_9BILA